MPTIELPKTKKAIAPQKGNVLSKTSPANAIEIADAVRAYITGTPHN
jgi:hypothetical protein